MAEIGEIVRVVLHYSQPNAGDCQNVFHFLMTDDEPTDAGLLEGIADWVTDVWAPDWAAIASSVAILEYIDVDIVNVAGEVLRNIGGAIIDVNGDSVTQVTSAAVSAYLLAYTELPKQRGSKYLPGLSEDAVASGTINPAYLGQLAILLADYLLDISIPDGGTIVAGILSKKLAEFIPFLASGAIEALPAYQRRRKAGVGI